MQVATHEPNRFAQDLFRPLPRRYDFLEALLSLGQNRRWRHEMISHVDEDDRARYSRDRRGRMKFESGPFFRR